MRDRARAMFDVCVQQIRYNDVAKHAYTHASLILNICGIPIT